MLNTQELKAALKQHMKEWEGVSDDDIVFVRLSGLTNIIYRVDHSKGLLPPVVFRKFGDASGLLERKKENIIYKELGEAGIGPQLYFASEGFRIEQFLQGIHHPTDLELKSPALKKSIVRKLVELHQTVLPETTGQQAFVDYFLSTAFLEVCEKGISEKKYDGERLQIYKSVTQYLTPEKLREVREVLCTMPPESIRFCHNDLNNLNIVMLNEEVKFIDFEYCRNNYLAYDIADFLIECAIDYSVKEPPYFKFKPELLAGKHEIREVCEAYHHSLFSYLDQQANKTGRAGNQLELDVVSRDVYHCMGLCNFYWAVWSLIMDNDIAKFDYLEHAKTRISLFEGVLLAVQKQSTPKQ